MAHIITTIIGSVVGTTIVLSLALWEAERILRRNGQEPPIIRKDKGNGK